MTQSELSKDLQHVDTQQAAIFDLCDKLGIETAVGKDSARFALANVLLLDRKQRDYGSSNIAEFGTFGCIVRMSDKFKRVINLFKNRRRAVVNESIRDSFRDFSNYGIIALMVEEHRWPGADKNGGEA